MKKNIYLLVVILFVGVIFSGCEQCPVEEQRYTTIHNNLDENVTLEFRSPYETRTTFFTENGFSYYSATLEANETKKINLELVKYDSQNPSSSDIQGMCSVVKKESFARVTFTAATIQGYTVCYDEGDRIYIVDLLSNQCGLYTKHIYTGYY